MNRQSQGRGHSGRETILYDTTVTCACDTFARTHTAGRTPQRANPTVNYRLWRFIDCNKVPLGSRTPVAEQSVWAGTRGRWEL